MATTTQNISIPLWDGNDTGSVEGIRGDSALGLVLAYPTTHTLHLPLKGANLDTITTDAMDNHRDIKFVNGAKIATAQSVIGGSSLEVNGGALEIKDFVRNYHFGNHDWTVACRMRFTSTPFAATSAFFNIGGGLGQWDQWEGHFINVLFHASFGYRIVWLSAPAANTARNFADGGEFSINTWHHVALVNDTVNSRLWFFIDGVDVAGGGSANITPFSPKEKEMGVNFGATYATGAQPSVSHPGFMDDIIIAPATALWTANFTPPTAALPYATTSPSPAGSAVSVAKNTVIKWSTASVVENAVDTDAGSIKYKYRIDGGAFSAWLTLAQLQGESDSIAQTSVEVQTQLISDGIQYATVIEHITVDAEIETGADDILLGGTLDGML